MRNLEVNGRTWNNYTKVTQSQEGECPIFYLIYKSRCCFVCLTCSIYECQEEGNNLQVLYFIRQGSQ